MTVDLKPYLYQTGKDAALDGAFSATVSYGKVKPGKTALFWKSALRWYVIPITQVQRIFRRVERMHIHACGGGRPFASEWLVLVLPGGEELEIHITDNDVQKAEALLEVLKERYPEMQFGKESL